MKMFNKINMASEYVGSLLKTCYFQTGATPADAPVEDGAIVSIKDIRAHDVYSGVYDLNARNCTAFDEDEPVYGIVDYVGVSHADVMGVNYKIGEKTAGCFPVAGESTRVRIPAVGDEFYLGNENFDGAPAAGKFAAPADGETTWAVSGTAAQSGLCIAIEDTRPLITGQVNEGSTLYRCRVISL